MALTARSRSTCKPIRRAERDNWLPAPKGGDFSLYVRAYWPKDRRNRWLVDAVSGHACELTPQFCHVLKCRHTRSSSLVC